MNVIYETPEGRPYWKLKPLQILIALAMVVGLILIALSIALTGPVVEAVADSAGIGDTPLAIWNIAKWPVVAGFFTLLLAFLNYTTPNAKLRGYRWVTPGSVFALVVWIAASGLFALYVANFGSYDKTYGTLGGIVSLLVWIWITNVAILLGAELNSERERAKELEEGKTEASEELQLPPRVSP
jgi:membrane protein